MDKKKAIKNTLLGKLQARSSKLFEDVNNEIWNGEEKEKDFTLEVDGEEVKEGEEAENEIKAIDAILGDNAFTQLGK